MNGEYIEIIYNSYILTKNGMYVSLYVRVDFSDVSSVLKTIQQSCKRSSNTAIQSLCKREVLH